jgi:hypothetical protein
MGGALTRLVGRNSGGVAPTPPTATYAYDFTGRPWSSNATGPSALYDSVSDKTYIVWEAQAQFRHIKVAAYNHATGTWSTPVVIDSHPLQDDDHGLPAIELLSDGRLVCFFGSHATNQEWSISAASGGVPTLTSWTRQTAVSGAYTYPKPVNIPDGSGGGTLYLFLRKTVSVNSRYILRTATYTSGGALTFSAETALIDFDGGASARVYAMEVRLNGSNIEFLATRADSGDTIRQHVYYFRYIVATGAKQNLDNSVSTSGQIDLTTANASYRVKTSAGSNVTGIVSWCRDSNNYLHIAYGDDTTNPWNVTHDWHNGTAWQGETTAFTVNRKGSTGYVEEWCLVPRGTAVDVYYPANNNGSFTGRGGDDIARKTWSGSWGSEVIVLAGDEITALGQPTAVKNADPDFRVMFSGVSQDETITSFGLHKRYFLGDSGYLEWPAPSDADAFKNILVVNFEGANNQTTYSDEGGWKANHPITFAGNAKLDSATAPPWGTTWLKLDGTGDYVSMPVSRTSLPDGGDWQWRGGDTLEVVYRPNLLATAQLIVATRDGSGGFQFFQESTNTIRFLGNLGGSTVVNMTSTTTVTTGTVYKIAVTRKTDGTWGLRVNGTEEATAASASITARDTLYIGRYGVSTSNMLNGWVKQVRWTKMASRDLSIVPSAHFPVS